MAGLHNMTLETGFRSVSISCSNGLDFDFTGSQYAIQDSVA